MAKLKDYPPADGLEFAQPDWNSAPCGQSKLSNALTRANFDALCDRFDDVDPNGATWEIVRFPHWKTDWVDVIFTKPESKCDEISRETRASLAQYPCLDEELWSAYYGEDQSKEQESSG